MASEIQVLVRFETPVVCHSLRCMYFDLDSLITSSLAVKFVSQPDQLG